MVLAVLNIVDISHASEKYPSSFWVFTDSTVLKL